MHGRETARARSPQELAQELVRLSALRYSPALRAEIEDELRARIERDHARPGDDVTFDLAWPYVDTCLAIATVRDEADTYEAWFLAQADSDAFLDARSTLERDLTLSVIAIGPRDVTRLRALLDRIEAAGEWLAPALRVQAPDVAPPP